MRNPYIVGRWLYGKDHYGRKRILDYLLTTQDPATWVVGTRRMGKTSLLRQLEWLTNNPESSLVPLFWDLQGCEAPAELGSELFISIEDQAQRFAEFDLNLDQLEDKDAIYILRTLQRAVRKAGKQLLLLVDETEALINVAAQDHQLLARLRKIFQSGEMRTVMTATQSLIRLNDLSRDSHTSPFLFGVDMRNLGRLRPRDAEDLIWQRHRDVEMEIDPDLVSDILIYTHRHPYLIQYLCYRLFEPISDHKGTLRPLRDEDLQPDQLLTGFLQIDFDHLVPIERQILLTVARHGVISAEALHAELQWEAPNRIAIFTHNMQKLGYVRPVYDQWTLGNEFLRRWVTENFDQLSHAMQAHVSDQGVESLLMANRQAERDYLHRELTAYQERLDQLIEKRVGYGQHVPPALTEEIQTVRREMNELLEQLNQLEASSRPPKR